MAENEKTKPKRKKPHWQEHITLYLNTQIPEDNLVFSYLKRTRNKSDYLRNLVMEDLKNRGLLTSTEYDYDKWTEPAMIGTVPVKVKQKELPITVKEEAVHEVEEIEEETMEEQEEVILEEAVVSDEVIEEAVEEPEEAENDEEESSLPQVNKRAINNFLNSIGKSK